MFLWNEVSYASIAKQTISSVEFTSYGMEKYADDGGKKEWRARLVEWVIATARRERVAVKAAWLIPLQWYHFRSLRNEKLKKKLCTVISLLCVFGALLHIGELQTWSLAAWHHRIYELCFHLYWLTLQCAHTELLLHY